jgi:hypothetical protein
LYFCSVKKQFTNMKRFLPGIISLLFCIQTLQAQVIYLEDFGGVSEPPVGGPYGTPYAYGTIVGGAGTWTFAPGWFLRNVDNLTPDPGVSYVNAAWEIREDFQLNVNNACAFSTSWYSPTGVANDWMWTPLVGPIPANTVLSWLGRAYDPMYPDGYEVRVMTSTSGPPTGGAGAIGNQITNSTQVFSTAAEGTGTWVSHSLNLSSYVGQSIYVGFHNNSNDKFVLVIDDVKLEVQNLYDAQLTLVDTVTEYTLTPKSQVSPLPLQGNIRNNGISNITNVRLGVDVLDPAMTVIYTNTSPAVATLTPGVTNSLNAGTWTPPNTPGTYTLKFYPVINETDQQSNNDTITRTVVISDFDYARDNGTVTGALGIGAGNGGFLGQEFQIYAPARLTSIQTYVTQGYTGAKYGAVVWDMAGGFPNAIVAYTDTLLYPDDSADFYTMPIDGGEFLLNPGSYVLTMIEFDSTLQIGLTLDIFTTNRTWVDWPTNPISPWGNNEDFGPGFQRSYVIRPEIYPPCPSDIITSISSTTSNCGSADGSATAVTLGSGPFTYNWSTGGNAVTENNLGVGTYFVTVTDVYSNCSETDTVSIINPAAPSIDNISVIDPPCFGDNANATAFVSGGTPSYTYLWTSGATTANVTLAAGNYTLTVTDAASCQAQMAITVTNPPVLGTSTVGTDETCIGCNDGTATVTATGGTGAYTYAWAPSGGTNATATGLATGTYTVTVTDANGCTSTSTVTIGSSAGIEDEIGLHLISIFPNPSTGLFSVTGEIKYEGEIKLEIVNLMGSVIFNKVMDIHNQINAVIELPISAGNYFLKISAGGYTSTQSLIIK